VATRKFVAARRRHYRTRLVDVPTRPTRFARSADPDGVDLAIRDPQAFHDPFLDGVDAADQAHIDEQLRMAAEFES